MYGSYYYWRSRRDSPSFVFYILAATVYNTYGCIWVSAGFVFFFRSNLNTTQDYLTDWSILRIHAKHPLLRDEILCADYLPVSEYPKDLT